MVGEPGRRRPHRGRSRRSRAGRLQAVGGHHLPGLAGSGRSPRAARPTRSQSRGSRPARSSTRCAAGTTSRADAVTRQDRDSVDDIGHSAKAPIVCGPCPNPKNPASKSLPARRPSDSWSSRTSPSARAKRRWRVTRWRCTTSVSHGCPASSSMRRGTAETRSVQARQGPGDRRLGPGRGGLGPAAAAASRSLRIWLMASAARAASSGPTRRSSSSWTWSACAELPGSGGRRVDVVNPVNRLGIGLDVG